MSFKSECKSRGIEHIISNTQSHDMLSECPWIIDFVLDNSLLLRFLSENNSLNEIMKKLRIPSCLKVSNVGEYRKLSNREVVLCNEIFDIKRPDLNSALSSFISRNGINGYSESYTHEKKLSLCDMSCNKMLWVLNHIDFDQCELTECLDVLNEKYDDHKKIRLPNQSSLNKVIQKWHEELAEKDILDKGRTPLDYGDIPECTKIRDFQIVSLLTEVDFYLDGKMMNHCVGTYYSRAKKDDCRIFSIRDKSGSRLSTLQVGKDYLPSQHRARFNKEPSSLEKAVAVEFCNNLKLKCKDFGINVTDSDNLVECNNWNGLQLNQGHSHLLSQSTPISAIDDMQAMININSINSSSAINTVAYNQMNRTLEFYSSNGVVQDVSLEDIYQHPTRISSLQMNGDHAVISYEDGHCAIIPVSSDEK